jgi:hypothetical protein
MTRTHARIQVYDALAHALACRELLQRLRYARTRQARQFRHAHASLFARCTRNTSYTRANLVHRNRI